MQERGSTVINGNRGLYGDSVLQTTNRYSLRKGAIEEYVSFVKGLLKVQKYLVVKTIVVSKICRPVMVLSVQVRLLAPFNTAPNSE
jgi:hypothetical protein